MRPVLSKILLTFTVAVYLTATIGLPVYLHYCAGELETVSCIVRSSDCCEDEEQIPDNGCCSEKSVFVQFTPDVLATAEEIQTAPAVLNLPLIFSHVDRLSGDAKLTALHTPAPPLIRDYIVACSVIRI